MYKNSNPLKPDMEYFDALNIHSAHTQKERSIYRIGPRLMEGLKPHVSNDDKNVERDGETER